MHNRTKPVAVPGPSQILLKIEACGICFSDTKLLHAFAGHPRKSEVRSGLPPGILAEIPSYVPGEVPTVPGHEAVGRIVVIGDAVRHHKLGERVLVQTDYRHLPTTVANAAFGYNFEGGLQEYVLLDERVIIEPGTGERFLLPVSDGPSASAIALVEPWACVEASYAYPERGHLLRGGRLLGVVDEGHAAEGLGPLVEANAPASATILLPGVEAKPGLFDVPMTIIAGLEGLQAQSFDDIVYFGADASRLERLQDLLAPRGVIDVVTAGAPVGRPVSLDVGRVHYDLTRWTGTTTRSAADGYARVPASGELRGGDRVAVIGAAGPMGLMHVVRSISGGWKDLSIAGLDIDDARLAHLERLAAPLARERGVGLAVTNSRTTALEAGFSYVALMVPAPALVAQALSLAGHGGRINIFAGFAIGTRAQVDLDRYLAEGCYFVGTSGSGIDDMKAVLAKLERGDLDTNISLDAVTGFEGFADAIAAVESRTSSGKIMVYPTLPELGLISLGELSERVPAAAAALDHGRWTRAAEEALLRDALRPEGDNGEP
ncbi:MAG: alcohol dehydrogenase catalytic domain-containing protein [Candidatus Limnocylindrales bacterium]